MNSSPEITVVSENLHPVTPEKATVPEMHILYHIIAEATLKGAVLRSAIQTCTPEERAFLQRFFLKVAVSK